MGDAGDFTAVDREANSQCLQELRVTPAMATDHLQPCYERALAAICQRLAREEEEEAAAVANGDAPLSP